MPSAQPGRRRIIKKVSGGGHHGGAWKVAYADFMTAMMALFLVLWLLASTDQKSRDEIARYFRTGIMPNAEMAMSGGAQLMPSVIEQTGVPPPPESRTIAAETKAVKNEIDRLLANHVGLADLAGKVGVQATDDGVLIEVVDDDNELLFDSASAALRRPLQEFLETLAPVLAKRPEELEIQGHTDARPFVSGAGKTNWDLSYERATAARLILESNGITAERIVGVVGRGAAVPLDRDEPYAARNRRLSVLLRVRPVASTHAQPAAVAAPAASTWDSLAPPRPAGGA